MIYTCYSSIYFGTLAPSRVALCRVVSRRAASCRVVSHRVASCRVVSCPRTRVQRFAEDRNQCTSWSSQDQNKRTLLHGVALSCRSQATFWPLNVWNAATQIERCQVTRSKHSLHLITDDTPETDDFNNEYIVNGRPPRPRIFNSVDEVWTFLRKALPRIVDAENVFRFLQDTKDKY